MLFFGYNAETQATRRSEAKGQYDLGIVLAALALASFGLVMVASSSIAVAEGQHVGSFYFFNRHLFFLSIGLAGAIVASRIELAWLERHALVLLLAGAVLLLLVFVPFIGVRINGARRWLRLGPIGFQSVEAVKILFVVYMASYLVRHRDSLQTKLLGVVKPLAITALFAVLLLAQPDFGSATLLAAVALGLIWLGGARIRDFALIGTAAVPLMGWVALSQDYRVRRLTSFLDPWADPFNDGFQLTQALIAIGRGEWLGVGLGGSVQKLFYLPMAHTDFILAVIAEELGFVGIVLVLGLFAWLVGRGFAIGSAAVERNMRFAANIAFGLSLMLSLQALVSIGVNLGVLPTKGLTLPLISSGGSSVMMTCVMVGLLARVSYEVSRAENAMLQAIAERQLVDVRTLTGASR